MRKEHGSGGLRPLDAEDGARGLIPGAPSGERATDAGRRAGSLAALGQAATYAVGLVLFFAVLMPAGYGGEDAGPVQTVAVLAENQSAVFVLDVVVYVLSSALQVVLAIALYERLKGASPTLMQVATAFGIIWAGVLIASGMVSSIGLSTVVDVYAEDPARAASAWTAVEVVRDGLGGGTEIVGGVWILLVSWVALRSAGLPRALNYLGATVGVAGILSLFPPLEALLAVFGLGILVWFVWLGVFMLREGAGRGPDAAGARRGGAMSVPGADGR